MKQTQASYSLGSKFHLQVGDPNLAEDDSMISSHFDVFQFWWDSTHTSPRRQLALLDGVQGWLRPPRAAAARRSDFWSRGHRRWGRDDGQPARHPGAEAVCCHLVGHVMGGGDLDHVWEVVLVLGKDLASVIVMGRRRDGHRRDADAISWRTFGTWKIMTKTHHF